MRKHTFDSPGPLDSNPKMSPKIDLKHGYLKNVNFQTLMIHMPQTVVTRGEQRTPLGVQFSIEFQAQSVIWAKLADKISKMMPRCATCLKNKVQQTLK